MKESEPRVEGVISRRLVIAGGASLAVVGACSPGQTADAGRPDAGSDAGTDAGTMMPDAGPCLVTPEGEIGPYFTDDSDPRFNRGFIGGNLDGSGIQDGIPLTLTVIVIDTQAACAPMAGVQVDIWHCNAAGVYSNEGDEGSLGETWLRGYQLTDANGKVGFQTIVPGWYAGRTTHIHLRLRSKYGSASSTSDGSNTTQLFFNQGFITGLASVAPYAAEGPADTTNATDRVFTQEELGANQLTLLGDNLNGYTATAVIHLPLTVEGDAGTMMPPSGDGGMPPGDGGMPSGDGGIPDAGP